MSHEGSAAEISRRLTEIFERQVIQHIEAGQGRRRPSAREIETLSQQAVRGFLDAAKEERQRHRLGIVGRARVAFGVQQRLLAAGYPAPLIKQVLFAMLVSAFTGR